MDFLPYQFLWHAVTLEQRVSDDPSFESLSSLVSYDHTQGRLGSDLTIGVEGSDDNTDNEVVLREEVWIEVPLPASFSGDVPVIAEFETVSVDQRYLKIDDEAGFSDLTISWKSQPYATVGYPKDYRIYDAALTHGQSTWGSFSPSPIIPKHVEVRTFRLSDLKGTVRLGVGIEHSVVGRSNDYSYVVQCIGDFKLTKITVVAG
jgi:hypothetical protein